MILLDAVHDLGVLVAFTLLVFVSAEMTRSLPRERGVKVERWRIMLALTVLVLAVTFIATAVGWASS